MANIDYKNYFIEEWVIRGDLSDIPSSVSWGEALINSRLFVLYYREKNIPFNKTEKITVNLDLPWKIKTPYNFHFLAVINKKEYIANRSNKNLNNLKIFIFKLINNGEFQEDLRIFRKKYKLKPSNNLDDYYKNINQIPILLREIKNIRQKYKLFNGSDRVIMSIIGLKNEYIINNIDEIALFNIDNDLFFNCFVYLIENIKEDRAYLNCQLNRNTDIADLKKSIIFIKYFQDKYFKGNKKESIKIKNLDSYLKLSVLDKTTKLSDWQKADEIFNPGEDTPMINTKEELKRRNRVRTMRKRAKKYFNT